MIEQLIVSLEAGFIVLLSFLSSVLYILLLLFSYFGIFLVAATPFFFIWKFINQNRKPRKVEGAK